LRYSPEEIAFLAEQVRVNGYALMEDLLPLDRIEEMRGRFEALLAEKAAAEPFNRGASRFQMYLPWEAPFADPCLYENDDVLALLEAVMGTDLALAYFASDTPLPGSDFQRVHSDTRLLFPETPLCLPPYGLVVNVPLVDCTEENGSLEFWPGGTHLMPEPADLQRLAPLMASRRANMRAGSLLARDLRMWHRGTPNRSSHARPHLALVYTRPWYRFEQQPPTLARRDYEALSERAQRLLRYARIEDS
jgi:ectoine hydroxylase-related dioxygenase (phytanoyl-CoA dioxygenase family)